MKIAGAIFICVLGCALVIGFNRAQQQETTQKSQKQNKRANNKSAQKTSENKAKTDNKTNSENKVATTTTAKTTATNKSEDKPVTTTALIATKPETTNAKVEPQKIEDSGISPESSILEDDSLVDEVFGSTGGVSENLEMDLDSEFEAELEKYKVKEVTTVNVKPEEENGKREKETQTAKKDDKEVVPDLNTDRRVKVIFKAGNNMVGVLKKDRTIEKKIRGVYRPVDDPKEYGAGIRLWYVDNSAGFIFLPYSSIKEIEKLEVVSVKREKQKSLEKSGQVNGNKRPTRANPRQNSTNRNNRNNRNNRTNRAQNRVRSARAAKY